MSWARRVKTELRVHPGTAHGIGLSARAASFVWQLSQSP